MKNLLKRIPRGIALATALTAALGSLQPASAAFKAFYGGNGNNLYTFSASTGNISVANLKTSGWNCLIMFAMNVETNGDLTYGGSTLVTNGTYVGDPNWGANVTALKTPPTTVYRYEVSVGGWGSSSYNNIKNLINSQGTGSGSILYRNFLALKNACPGINAINDDDEGTYDYSTKVAFANMLYPLGYHYAIAPYTNQAFWVSVRNALAGKLDIVYLQCYDGGAGNSPSSWSNAFESDGSFKVVPGLNTNAHSQSQFASWASSAGVGGGFYWPDFYWFTSSTWEEEIENGIGWVPNGSSGGYVCEVANLKSGINVSPYAGGTANGTDVVQHSYTGINERCKVTWVQSPVTYKITSNPTGKALEIAGSSTSTGAHVQIRDYSGGNNQKVQFSATSGWLGYFTLKWIHSGQAMGVYNGSTAQDAQLIQYTINNANDQQWQIRCNYASGW